MNPLDLFLGTGDAVRMIFKLGYVPEESEFYELTCDQYKHYFEIYGHTDEKIFMLIPNESSNYKKHALDGVYCLTESEIDSLEDGKILIEKYCEKGDHHFESFDEKLRYAASLLPSIFSKDTPYSRDVEP